MKGITEAFAELEKYLDNQFNLINKRFETLHESVEALDRKLDKIEKNKAEILELLKQISRDLNRSL
jgi:archaellum component FlaC